MIRDCLSPTNVNLHFSFDWSPTTHPTLFNDEISFSPGFITANKDESHFWHHGTYPSATFLAADLDTSVLADDFTKFDVKFNQTEDNSTVSSPFDLTLYNLDNDSSLVTSVSFIKNIARNNNLNDDTNQHYFIGLDGLELCNRVTGKWFERLQVDIYPFVFLENERSITKIQRVPNVATSIGTITIDTFEDDDTFSWQDIIGAYIIPTIGSIISLVMNSISLKPLFKAEREKKMDKFDIISYVSLLGNNLTFLIYAIVHDFNPFVYTTSSYGTCCSIWSIIVIYNLTSSRKKKLIAAAYLYLSLAVILFVCYSFSTFSDDPEVRKFISGILANVFAVIFFAAPVTVFYKVIKKRNAKYLFWPFVIVNFISNALWVVYGNVLGDILFWWPNAIGMFFCLIQLILVLIFRDKKKNKNIPNSERALVYSGIYMEETPPYEKVKSAEEYLERQKKEVNSIDYISVIDFRKEEPQQEEI